MKVEIYSDVVCPWCYVGERRFGRALEAFAGEVEVVFRPYQLQPDAPETPVPLPEYLERRFGGSVGVMLKQATDAARGEGIEMAWDRALSVNTREAHRLLRLAEREYGAAVQRALAEKLFHAHFTAGGDVSDHGLLAGLGEEAGMDRARVEEYLSTGEGRDALEAELREAAGLGIRAVPTFVIDGRYMVEGAQSAAVFLKVLEEMGQREAGPEEGGGEGCEDGSCAV